MDAVVAKMKCNTVESTHVKFGPHESHQQTTRKVRLGAIYGTEGENKHFTAATPSGECWMQIDENAPALGFFEPGCEYYVTFTKAQKK